MLTGKKICRRCGEPIPPGALGGNCPRCLAGLALSSTAAEAENSPRAAARPTPEHFFGDYEILGELARGGMGIVYRARQVSLNRPVALKMIASGQLATPAQVQRFRLEAEAAARLDHPNIVPIHEVGEHQGQHFYSMKLVEGGTLAGVNREQRAARNPADSISQTRVGLSGGGPRGAATILSQIARAVHYAHQRGVLHRDLKPTNILIDLEGRPHITDFGLAKLSEEDAGLTQSTALFGTPAYMAPELAAGKAGEATTAADVYGLGAILYQLLADQPPFAAKNVPALLRKILEEEVPVQPLRNPGQEGAFGSTEPNRAPSKACRVPRDLEIICLKSLEKDPANRYASAAALADDLDRWLNDEPIQARPATGTERIRRWCRRKPALAGLSVALTVAVLGGLVVGSLLLWREKQASRQALAAERTQRQLRAQAEAGREQARIEAAKSLHLARFLQQMLYRVGPSVSLGRDTTLLREILDQTAGQIGGELTNQPAVAAELYETVGHTYYDLGDYAKAAAMHRESLRLRRPLVGDEHAEVAQSRHLLAQALAAHGELDEAEALDHQTLALRKRLFGPDDVRVAGTLNNLGNVYFRRRDLAHAQQYFEQAMAIYRRHDHPAAVAVLNNLANVQELKPDYPAAERLYRDAVAMARRVHGDAHPVTALCLRNLAESLRGQDRFGEADAIHSEALAVRASLLDELHPLLADSFERLGLTKSQEHMWAEAETLYRKALDVRRKQFPKDARRWDEDANALANVLNEQQKFDETDRVLTELLVAAGAPNPHASGLHAIRGSARARHGQWQDAVPDLARAVDLDPANHWNAWLLSTLLVETRDLPAYRLFCGRSLATFGQTTDPDVATRMALACLLAPTSSSNHGAADQLIDRAMATRDYGGLVYAIPPKALADYRCGRPAEAVSRIEELLSKLERGKLQGGRYVQIEARAVLSLAHHALGHHAEARATLARALDFAPVKIATPTNSDYGTSWHEWLILHVLLREAGVLIQGAAPESRIGPEAKP